LKVPPFRAAIGGDRLTAHRHDACRLNFLSSGGKVPERPLNAILSVSRLHRGEPW
jgi:hypothetical protein